MSTATNYCRERRLEWADQLAPLIRAQSEMGAFVDRGERPQTSRLVRWDAWIGVVLDAILRNGPDAPKWPEYQSLLAEHDTLKAKHAELLAAAKVAAEALERWNSAEPWADGRKAMLAALAALRPLVTP